METCDESGGAAEVFELMGELRRALRARPGFLWGVVSRIISAWPGPDFPHCLDLSDNLGM